MKWCAFFSQTGSEIIELTNKLNKQPDFIITNNESVKKLDIYNKFNDRIIIIPKKPKEEDYFEAFSSLNINAKETLITLHGYLRIIPESLCNNFKIINLHPGLITKYPELKGIDPQKKATVLKHSEIGCVLHKVIKEVDSGEILMANSTESTYDVDENIKLLRCISIELWTDYLNSSLRF